MKALKEVLICVLPYMLVSLLLYPFAAIIGGGTDPFLWDRPDRIFYFISTVSFGTMLVFRLLNGRE